MAQRWHIYSEVVGKDEEGHELWTNYGMHPVLRKPPRKPPAGGTIEKSGDGNWLTVYRPAREGEGPIATAPTGFRPVKVFVRLGTPTD